MRHGSCHRFVRPETDLSLGPFCLKHTGIGTCHGSGHLAWKNRPSALRHFETKYNELTVWLRVTRLPERHPRLEEIQTIVSRIAEVSRDLLSPISRDRLAPALDANYDRAALIGQNAQIERYSALRVRQFVDLAYTPSVCRSRICWIAAASTD